MISGAAGSTEATAHAIRSLAEFLMVVLQDDANMHGLNSHENQSSESFLEELRHLHFKIEDLSQTSVTKSKVEVITLDELGKKQSPNINDGIGPLHVKRTRDWLEKTTSIVDILLSKTFPNICLHPSKKVKRGLLSTVYGLLSKCSYTLKGSRMMLLMHSVSMELEILGRHQHPELTIHFLKAVAEIAKAAKQEAYMLPVQAESFLADVNPKVSYMKKKIEQDTISAGEPVSCLTTVTPLLASEKEPVCLVAMSIIEDGIVSLAKVEEAFRLEKETKEGIEEVASLCSFYNLADVLDAAEGTDENRLLPAMIKIWPFLVACVQSRIPVLVRRCAEVITTVVKICGGSFFSRRFHNDGPHFWKLLSTSPFKRKPISSDEKVPLLPYRSTSRTLEDPVSESSNLKTQAAVLQMISELSRDKKSASALEAVLKKVSGLVVGIACSGVTRLRDASVDALLGLASIDPDLIWLLVADVYYSMQDKNVQQPNSAFPELAEILPLPTSSKHYLYVHYGGQTYSFDVHFTSVENAFKKLYPEMFATQAQR